MSDRRLRELEAQATAGDPKAAQVLALLRVRLGRANAVDEAHAAWSGGERTRAFELLRARWEECPAPELAEALGALTREVALPRGGVKGRTRALLQRAWYAVEDEGDCFDLPRLLEAQRLLLGGAAVELFDEIEAWPRDPRVSEGLVALIVHVPGNWRGRKHASLWRRCLAQIARIADPRAREVLRGEISEHDYPGEAEPDDVGAIIQAGLRELVAALPAAPALPSGEGASLRALLANLEGGVSGALWEAVYAAPMDEAPRRALAEALEASGDPRGEFIRLQLDRALGGSVSAREARLLRDHGEAWKGSLGPLGRVEFAGGFPAAFSALRTQAPDPQDWATVRRLEISHATDSLLKVLPSVPSEVFGLPLKRLKVGLPCEVVGLDHVDLEGLSRLYALKPDPALRALELTRLGPEVEPADLAGLWTSPIGAQLEHFSFGPPQGIDCSVWLGAVSPGELAEGLPLVTIRIWGRTFWASDERLGWILYRGESGAFTRLCLRLPGSLGALKGQLKKAKGFPGVTSVRLEVSAKALRSAKAADRRRVESLLGALVEDFEIVEA